MRLVNHQGEDGILEYSNILGRGERGGLRCDFSRIFLICFNLFFKISTRRKMVKSHKSAYLEDPRAWSRSWMVLTMQPSYDTRFFSFFLWQTTVLQRGNPAFQGYLTRIQTTSTREWWRRTDDCGVSRRSNRVVKNMYGADDAAFPVQTNLEEELIGDDEYGDSTISKQVWSRTCMVLTMRRFQFQ